MSLSRASLSEQELIKRARSGDENAFAQLVSAHASRVYGALRRFGLDAGEAEEVAQEVFLRAWRGLVDLAVPDRVQRGSAPADPPPGARGRTKL
jgi:DNA-directed RNA polymerase specialized sigma24 family protein